MLDQIRNEIDRINKMGAVYVDARWYPIEEANFLLMWNGNLKTAAFSRESGLGVRVLYKGAWGFSATSDLGNLSVLFDKAFDNARIASQRVTFPVRLAEKEFHSGEVYKPRIVSTHLPFPLTTRSLFYRRWMTNSIRKGFSSV